MATDLTSGERYTFERFNGLIVCTDATDYSNATTIFRNKNVEIVDTDGNGSQLLKLDSSLLSILPKHDTQPAIAINAYTNDGNATIRFSGRTSAAHLWTIGVPNDVDAFRISNQGTVSSSMFTILNNGDVGIGDSAPSYRLAVNGDGSFTTDLTVGDDLFVEDCAHIDALHVGTGTDTDPGPGNLLVDGKLKFHAVSDEDVITIAQTGENYGYIKWYDSDSGNDQAAWIGHDAGSNRFTIKVKDENGANDSKYYHFQENGVAIFPGSITVTSDARLKENIRTLDNPLKQILLLNGLKFNWKHDVDKRDYIGFVAQEVEKVIPEAVITSKATTETDGSIRVDNQKSVAYQDIIPVLVEAIKELSAKVEALEKRLGDQ